MRIFVTSDWHLEHHKISEREALSYGVPDADVCVVAGDIHRADISGTILADQIGRHMPVIQTLGNHEFYGWRMPVAREEARMVADAHPKLHLLDPGIVVIGETRFIGATLWCDYDLHGPDRRQDAMKVAARSINDHQSIAVDYSNPEKTEAFAWMPDHARERHLEELAFIEGELAKPFAGKTVVVTHHGPHPKSIHARFQAKKYDLLNASFVSNLESTILRFEPDAWLHGHIHNSADYRVGKTRVVANPRGYQVWRGSPPGMTLVEDPVVRGWVDPVTRQPVDPNGPHRQQAENPDFDPHLVIEV